MMVGVSFFIFYKFCYVLFCIVDLEFLYHVFHSLVYTQFLEIKILSTVQTICNTTNTATTITATAMCPMLVYM